MTGTYNLLTAKQKKVYSIIEAYIKEKGIPPTVREIGEIVGEKTPGAVQGILKRLEQKGAITRGVGMARSIQLANDTTNYVNSVYVPEIKKINTRYADDLLNIYNIDKYHPCSSSVLKDSKDVFIVACPDKSLNCISDNDYLIISRDSKINDGDIVIALYENHALLRYYTSSTQDTVSLKADIDIIGKETFNNNEVTIIGKLIGKVTNY